MGEVEVMVGCPHRVRAPIGSRTKYPCDACAPYGPPGWPRWAIAMTVDYGPRVSAAAVEGAAPAPDPTRWSPEVREAIAKVVAPVTQAMRLVGEAMEPSRNVLSDFITQAVQRDLIGLPPSSAPLRIERQSETERDRQSNTVRFQITAEERLSMDVAHRIAMQQPPRLRIVP